MVGVSGFEPEASWTRTKRDTKLRHTPKAQLLYACNRLLSSIKVYFSLWRIKLSRRWPKCCFIVPFDAAP